MGTTEDTEGTENGGKGKRRTAAHADTRRTATTKRNGGAWQPERAIEDVMDGMTAMACADEEKEL